MDPEYEQRGHRARFLDAFGKLRIAKSIILLENSNCQYHAVTFGQFRAPGGASGTDLNRQIDERWYFRNYVKCLHDFKG